MVTQPETEVLENLPDEGGEEEAPAELDTAAEIAAMKLEFAEIKGATSKVANQVGYAMRELERIAKQPQSPARDERFDQLSAEFEELRISLITDPDEKAELLQKKLTEARKPRVETPQAPVEEGTPREWGVIGPRLVRLAASRGVSYDAAIERFPKSLADFGGDWSAWEEAAEKVIYDMEEETERKKTTRTTIQSDRAGAGSNDAAIRKAFAAGEIPFSPRVKAALDNAV